MKSKNIDEIKIFIEKNPDIYEFDVLLPDSNAILRGSEVKKYSNNCPMLSLIESVSLDEMSTCAGRTADSAGIRRTSSKVKASGMPSCAIRYGLWHPYFNDSTIEGLVMERGKNRSFRLRDNDTLSDGFKNPSRPAAQ